jgi:S1-C subfamily serine protease
VRALHAFLVLVLLLLFSGVSAAMELPELMDRTKPAVALVTVYDSAGHMLGTGTGFCVSPDGRFVTNVHVVAHAARATLTLADGRVVAVSGLLAQDPAADVAVVQAESGPFPAPLELGDSRTLVTGQEVDVVGSPEGLSSTLSTGIVAAIRDGGVTDPGVSVQSASYASWRIQITAPISPGSSGSPVLTRDGRVVGVAVGQRRDGQNLNFCVPIELARELLDGLGDHPTVQPLAHRTTAGELARNLGLSAAIFAACALGYELLRRRWTRKAPQAQMRH